MLVRLCDPEVQLLVIFFWLAGGDGGGASIEKK